jgi:hypothetical protein
MKIAFGIPNDITTLPDHLSPKNLPLPEDGDFYGYADHLLVEHLLEMMRGHLLMGELDAAIELSFLVCAVRDGKYSDAIEHSGTYEFLVGEDEDLVEDDGEGDAA